MDLLVEVAALALLNSMLKETWKAGRGPRYAVIMTTSASRGHAEQLL